MKRTCALAILAFLVLTPSVPAQDWTKENKDRAKRDALHGAFQLVRGDSGKWNDDARLQIAPPPAQKPAKMTLDAWADTLLKKKPTPTELDDVWLILRAAQLDDNDRVWVERITRRGSQITVTAHLAKWQGKYFRNFTYYPVIAVNLGTLEPGKYEATWHLKPWAFSKFDGDGKALDANWPQDERPLDQKPAEVRLSFVVGKGKPSVEKLSDAELRDRLARSPRQVAEQLAAFYGKKLDQVAYIPALPLVAKLRLSELTKEPRYAKEVDAIVAPYLRGDKTPTPKSGSEQAGHLIFAELARRAEGKDRERWVQLCRIAADQIFKDGKALPIMPFHSEMSDAVFMAGPILAATGKLTGDRKYFDAAATHFASMRKLCLRKDGLYRHSPLCEAAWGRGNGFPALGLALALSDWPEDHPAFKKVLAEFTKHLAALKPHQDAKTGCWHQVIDHPESYDEYSCTCMIGFAMQRGIRRGWLAKKDYQSCVDHAWRSIKERTSSDGKLVNVCTGTGKQKTLQDYFNRPAINGPDARGGAMGMMFATEMMGAE